MYDSSGCASTCRLARRCVSGEQIGSSTSGSAWARSCAGSADMALWGHASSRRNDAPASPRTR
eukprot:298529-Chlamydomonas_euryale.AAC.1